MRGNGREAANFFGIFFTPGDEAKPRNRAGLIRQAFMSEQSTAEITQILRDWNDGDEDAKERLIPFVYDELKRQARGLMSQERSNHTLQPTALVHEAFLRLSEGAGIDWQNRSHFYGIAARVMRRILVDHARLHATEKRGHYPIQFFARRRADSRRGTRRFPAGAG